MRYRDQSNSSAAVGSNAAPAVNITYKVFVILSPILNLAIDFSIHIDFVESLPNYFAVMQPALLLMFAATLYRVGYAFLGAPAEWANFSPLAALLLCGIVYLPKKTALFLGAGPIVVADLILNAHYHAPLIDTGILSRYFSFGLILLLGFWIKQQRYSTSRARITEAAPSTVRIPIQRRQS